MLKEWNLNHSETLNGPHTQRNLIRWTPEVTLETSESNGTNLDVDADDDDDDVILFCWCHSQTPCHIVNTEEKFKIRRSLFYAFCTDIQYIHVFTIMSKT
jgi:hypothetical protein